MGAGADGLRVEVLVDLSGVQVLKVIGELDLASAESLQASIGPILEREPTEIVFDLSELQFMDSSGITLLVTVAQRVETVELRDPRPMVRRIIELTGLSGVFRMTSSTS